MFSGFKSGDLVSERDDRITGDRHTGKLGVVARVITCDDGTVLVEVDWPSGRGWGRYPELDLIKHTI